MKKIRRDIKYYHKHWLKKDKKDRLEYYKFIEVLFKDYEIFDTNKIYNNAIINNYKIIKYIDAKNYLCDKENIDYTSQNFIEQNLIHKINEEKHFYISNPMLIKLNNYSDAIGSIDYTLLDNIIYNNDDNENIVVFSVLCMENIHNNN